MLVELTETDIEVLLVSLNSSLERVRDAKDTPYGVRAERLHAIESVVDKLRVTRKGSAPAS